MKFNCENCGTRYTLSDEKVKNRILKIRCKVCEDVIIVRDPVRARSQPPSLAPAPKVEVEWYVSRDGGAPQGPMPIERLEDQVRTGALKPSDMVWNQDMADWAKAEETLAAQFDAARATVPRPALPSPAALRGLPRPPGRVKEPAPLLPRPRSGVRTPAPLAAPSPKPPSAKSPSPKPPARPDPPAREVAPPKSEASVPESAPPAPTPAPEGDASTQAMAADLGALLSQLDGAADAPSDDADDAANDTVALPASGPQIDTLFAPAATASAAASMQANDTSLLPGVEAEEADGPGPSAAAAPDQGAPAVEARPSDAAPALPSSAPPAVADAPDDDAAPVAPVEIAPPPAAITMTGEQVAFAEGAFFGTDQRPAAASASSDAFVDTLSSGAHPVGDEPRSKLPLLIVLGVLLLGGGIGLGVMLASGDGGPAPATTGSAASVASKAPETEAPASLAAAETDAPASEAPASAVSEAPPSEAPATAASVASAAPATKAPTRRPSSTAPSVRPKTVKSVKSTAPATRPSRFAALNGDKPDEVPAAALKTEAVVELPETLSPGKISRIIRRYKKGLHGCYQRQLKRDASMRKANLKLAFNIERSGRTSNIKVDRKYDGTELKTCLNRLVRRWRFPQFTGESIPVEYPLFFQASL